jgi:eukaryotic-like serine/threonine-protein kinase
VKGDKTPLPGRFEPERSVASGGMGVVYLARDRQTSERVAVKVLHKGLEDDARFEREAAMLATLSHDAIVRYIAHGIGADKRPFIAMEWLEGEDLGKRLSRGPLTPLETTTLLKRVSEALSVVHRAGLVHRDIKPDNIFLPAGELGRAKLVDFGLARPPRARMLTAEGIVVGTPGYMAPEQIRGEVPDARVDVFALGCVAYQCLTGKPPFRGGNAVAVLTKVLIEPAEPIAQHCPDAPRPLVLLVGRMMAKERSARPADGHSMIAELAGLDRGLPKQVRLSGAERILAAVLVVAWFSTRFDHYQASIEEIAKQHGARVEAGLGHGTIIAFSRTKTAEEQAILATRAALEMARLPGVRASLAIAATEGTLSEAIESAGTAPLSWPRGSVLIDDVTDRLLPSRFERVPVGTRFAIVAEREGVDLPRLVLGRPTPFVGRQAELGALIARTESLLGHSQAGVLTVMGEAGIGKSRLRHEALRVIAGSREPAHRAGRARRSAIARRAAGALHPDAAPRGRRHRQRHDSRSQPSHRALPARHAHARSCRARRTLHRRGVRRPFR